MSRVARTNKRIITTMNRYARSARWLLAGGLLFAASAAAQSDYIRDVETELQQLGYDVGAINGVFDDTLESAINRFKADEGLPPLPGADETAGPATQGTEAGLGQSSAEHAFGGEPQEGGRRQRKPRGSEAADPAETADATA